MTRNLVAYLQLAAGFMGVMPVSALVLSYVLLGEPFEWPQLAGFAVVFAGVLLIARTHARSAASARAGDEEENGWPAAIRT